MSVKVEFDPANQYQHCTYQQLIDAAGLIPQWVVSMEEADIPANAAAEHLLKMYGFPSPKMEGGSFEGWTYKYPEDPDMHPYMIMRYPGGLEVACYQHSMFAFRLNGVTHMHRMD